jgi:D-amino-acid dehydrogenase
LTHGILLAMAFPDRHTRRRTSQERSRMNSNRDVLIIGGGSIGLNCAYYLLQAGRQVTLIDSGNIADGSSTGNAGHIVPSHIIPLAAPGVISDTIKWLLRPSTSPFGMKFSLAPDYLRWLLRFARNCSQNNVDMALAPLKALGELSAQNYAQLIEEEGISCNYQQKGLLFLYCSAAAFQAGKEEAKLLSSHGVIASSLEQGELRRLEPEVTDAVIGGVLYPGDAHLNPGLFLQQLAERVRVLGAEIHEQCPVQQLRTTDQRIIGVTTERGEFCPEEIVLAAGAWSPELVKELKMNLPVQAAKGYSITVTAPPETEFNHALLLGEQKIAASPMGDLLRFTGRLELSDLDMSVNHWQIQTIMASARNYLRLPRQLNFLSTWAGLRPTTPDGLPIIGRSDIYPNLILATGHAMLGLSLGPGTGQLVAEIVCGRRTVIEPDRFGPSRF